MPKKGHPNNQPGAAWIPLTDRQRSTTDCSGQSSAGDRQLKHWEHIDMPWLIMIMGNQCPSLTIANETILIHPQRFLDCGSQSTELVKLVVVYQQLDVPFSMFNHHHSIRYQLVAYYRQPLLAIIKSLLTTINHYYPLLIITNHYQPLI